MSNDYDPIQAAMQSSQKIDEITQRMAKTIDEMRGILSSFPTFEVDLESDDDDIPEDESYSTGRDRACRFLGEMLFACFSASINFSVRGNDNHEGFVHYAAVDSVPDDDDYRITHIGSAYTTWNVAQKLAHVLAEVLEETIKRRARIVSADYELEVTITDGRYIDLHTGEVYAENIREIVHYCKSENCDLVIVPDYY